MGNVSSYITPYRLLLLLVLGSLIPLVGIADSRSPYQVALKGAQQLANLKVGQSAWLSAHTAEGIVQVRLTRSQKQSPRQYRVSKGSLVEVPNIESALFFKGKVLSKSNRRNPLSAASATIVGDSIRIFLPGNRKRVFATTVKLSQVMGMGPALGWSSFTRSASGVSCSTSAVVPSEALKRSFPASVATASEQVDVATYADSNYISSKGDQANATILSIMNQVDSIYSDQLGISVNVSAQVLISATSELTATDAGTLLQQFGTYVNDQNLIDSADLHHLFTGKNTTYQGNPNVAGLAYQGVLCESPLASFGLSENLSLALSTVVTAHELGHNFNASHDSATPSIMSPTSSASYTSFSDFSLDEMLSWVSTNGSCLASTGPDITLVVALTNRNRFKATVTTANTSALDCTIDIYGLPKRSTAQDSPENGSLLLTVTPDTDGTATVYKSLVLSKTARTATFYRAVMTCGDSQYLSDVESVEAESGNGLRSATDSRFFTHLQSRL